jgi:hypothetical protein
MEIIANDYDDKIAKKVKNLLEIIHTIESGLVILSFFAIPLIYFFINMRLASFSNQI